MFLKSRKKKRLVVCDYPSKYTFPSFGFGSAEKRIWSLAKIVSESDDFEVIIAGPLWLPKYVPKAKYFEPRLDKNSVNMFLKKFGRMDYLFAGHEYFGKKEYEETFFKVARKLMSYQGNIYDYGKIAYDAKTKYLFCYSDEMMIKYREQKPFKVMSYHGGVNENYYLTNKPKNYLVWMGRIDTDKSPHYAILAAEKLKMPLYILGDSKYQKDYEKKYEKILRLPIVKRCGVVYGPPKIKFLSEALCGIYTVGPNYTEAGAGVLGEILRCGVPLVGMSWKGNDAVCEAIEDNLGRVVIAKREMSEDEIAYKLSESVKFCIKNLDRRNIFKLANEKYNPVKLAKKMFSIVDGKN